MNTTAKQPFSAAPLALTRQVLASRGGQLAAIIASALLLGVLLAFWRAGFLQAGIFYVTSGAVVFALWRFFDSRAVLWTGWAFLVIVWAGAFADYLSTYKYPDGKAPKAEERQQVQPPPRRLPRF